MSNANAPETPTDATFFSATLTPYRSLSPQGFLIVMALIGTLSFLVGLAFWWLGAWPIFGFLGLDVLLIYLAFRANYRSARAYEEVALTQQRLTVRQVDWRGRGREFEFNPYWARLEVVRRGEMGVTTVRIASHGKRLIVGAFLHRDDRERFAQRLDAAMAAARAGGNPAAATA